MQTYTTMTANEGRAPQTVRTGRRRTGLRVATGFAILGGMLFGGGYFWVTAIAVNNEAGYYGSSWKTYPIGPGLGVFITGSVIVFCALLAIRCVRDRNCGGHRGGRDSRKASNPSTLSSALREA